MISILVAMDKNRVIGVNNQLPWHLPADLQYFKRITMGNPIIMGRKTFDSIGRVLPGRENVVLTRSENYSPPGCTIIHSVEEIKTLRAERKEEELFVIGGAELFRQVLDFTDRLYITQIEAEFEGDTFFPEINLDEWNLISKEKGIKDEKNPYEYYFLMYERI